MAANVGGHQLGFACIHLELLEEGSLCTCSAGYKLWSCSLHLCIS